jgi:hypothetical protein
MQIRDEHVVVVVVGRRVVVVVVVGLRVVVVVVVVGVVVAAVVVVVVVVVVDESDAPDEAEDDGGVPALVVVVAPVDCEAGGIGSTAPNSDGSLSAWPSLSVPKANNVQAIAPTTAPTASRPCPFCRVDPIGVLRVYPATTGS